MTTDEAIREAITNLNYALAKLRPSLPPEPDTAAPAEAVSNARALIIAKGQGWCAFTHQHDNSKAALASAREALAILASRYDVKGYRQPEMLTALIAELSDGNPPAQEPAKATSASAAPSSSYTIHPDGATSSGALSAGVSPSGLIDMRKESQP